MTWTSIDKNHRHRAAVIINPDTVVLWVHEASGHVHVASVPIAQVVSNGGLLSTSVDAGHSHSVKLKIL